MNGAIILTALSIAVALLTGVEAQTIRSCNDVRNDLAGKRIPIFENAEGAPNVVSELCVDFTTFR